MPWYEAIDQPGAGQMIFGRQLMESRPFLTRIPDNSIVVTSDVPSSVPEPELIRLWPPATKTVRMPWFMFRWDENFQ